MRYNTSQINIGFKDRVDTFYEGKITSGEFFAGGGGWTEGLSKVPDIKTEWLLNHDKLAISVNAFHHPQTKIYWSDIYVQDEHELNYVDHIHASVECQDHSNAKAGEEKRIGSYTMGWELYRYIRYLMPLVLTVENVPEFKKWAPLDAKNKRIKSRAGEEFERWKQAFIDLGYEYTESIRNAAYDGMPTSRVRYFGVFHRPGIVWTWPPYTHSERGGNGKKRWIACKKYIDLEYEGESIFGRQFNEQLPKGKRKPLCANSLRRIAAGAIKYSPKFRQLLAIYYGGNNPTHSQSIEQPIGTITTVDRYQLITLEKMRFIADHCRVDNYQTIDRPLKTQLTWQTKQLVSLDHFLCQYYGTINTQSINDPIKTIVCRDIHQLVRIEKMHFISNYLTQNGSAEGDLPHPLLDSFDIKARFLNPQELAACTTFPPNYFNEKGLKVSNKNAIRMIGNAVPPQWAEVIMKPNIESIRNYKVMFSSAKKN